MPIRQSLLTLILFVLTSTLQAQDYFFKDKAPFDASIPSPEEFLERYTDLSFLRSMKGELGLAW